jgi:hypothetical protein
MPNTICEYATKNPCNNISHKSCTMPQGLFRSSVPHGYNHSQTWAYRSFSRAEKEANG